jgi:hypothetical protein
MVESIFEIKTLRMTILLVDAVAMVGTRSRAARSSKRAKVRKAGANGK